MTARKSSVRVEDVTGPYPRLREGDTNPRTRLRNAPLIDRMMYRTSLMDNGCWLWLGSCNPKGYGHIRDDQDGALVAVHRAIWVHLNGPIPGHLEVDHVVAWGCVHRACVNPDHLELVTHHENVNRGRHNQNHGKTHCDHGHEFTPENTRTDSDGKRRCRTCQRRRTQEYRERLAQSW